MRTIEAELQTIKNLNRERMAALQEKIESGQLTTGDAIKDFVIVYHGASEKIEAKYQKLNTRLTQHLGEFVLVKRMEKEPWEEHTQIGIINDKTPFILNIQSGWITLAPLKYAYLIGQDLHRSKPLFVNKDLTIDPYNFLYMEKSVESFYGDNFLFSSGDKEKARGVKDLMFELLIGDKKVSRFLEKRALLNLYPEIAGQLGRQLKTP